MGYHCISFVKGKGKEEGKEKSRKEKKKGKGERERRKEKVERRKEKVNRTIYSAWFVCVCVRACDLGWTALCIFCLPKCIASSTVRS